MRPFEHIAIAVAALVLMEGASYAAHRWVMHGFAMRWHRSHHLPARGGWEANDLFPAVFALLGFAMFIVAAITGSGATYAAAIGITAYGMAYLFVHEIYIHRRLSIRVQDTAYLCWVKDAHSMHHAFGGEPYGMLLPVVSAALRARASGRDPLDTLARLSARASSNAETRSRL